MTHHFTNTTLATHETSALTAPNILFVHSERNDVLFKCAQPQNSTKHLTVVAACADGTFYPGLSDTWAKTYKPEADAFKQYIADNKPELGECILINDTNEDRRQFLIFLLKESVEDGFHFSALKSCMIQLMDSVRPLGITSISIALSGVGPNKTKNLYWMSVIDAYMKVFKRMDWINVQIMASEGCIARYPRIVVVDTELVAHGIQAVLQKIEAAPVETIAPKLKVSPLAGEIIPGVKLATATNPVLRCLELVASR